MGLAILGPPKSTIVVLPLSGDWQGAADVTAAVETFLRDGGARAWQRELVAAALAEALHPPADGESVDGLGD